jgi:WD40 repeat protein
MLRLAGRSHRIPSLPSAPTVSSCGTGTSSQLSWLNSDTPISSVAFDPAGEVLAFGDEAGVVRFCRDPAREFVLRGKVSALHFLRKRFLVAASFDNSASILDLVNHECLEVLRHPAAVRSLAVIRGGERLATGCEDGVARIWDVREIMRQDSAAAG